MYYYSTVGGIVMTHSALETDEYSMPCVRVHFERPNDNNGFDFADGRIPHSNFQKAFGFSEDELFKLRDYMRNNAFLIWKFAQKGGASVTLDPAVAPNRLDDSNVVPASIRNAGALLGAVGKLK